jgi:glucokinase
MSDALELVRQWLRRGDGAFVGGQGLMLGIDVGSYGLRAIVADLRGTTVFGRSSELPVGDASAITDAAIALVRDLLTEHSLNARQLVRIGIGFGGPVDADVGTTRVHYRRPGWENFPLVERFEAAFDAPTLLDNDANVIALGEACCVDRDVRDLLYVHLSSGVGGGVVVDGRLYHGATTTAGEIGHAIVHPDGPPCSCGGKGHLESYLSIGGLLRRMGELGVSSQDLTTVFGDSPAAQQTVEEATATLSQMLANAVTLLDPQVIVVGGIVARTGGDAWLSALQQQLKDILPPTLRSDIQVLPSSFNHDSVAVGGLALALASMQD